MKKSHTTTTTFTAYYVVNFTETPPSGGGAISDYTIVLVNRPANGFLAPGSVNEGGNFDIQWNIATQGPMPATQVTLNFSFAPSTTGYSFSGFTPTTDSGSGLTFGSTTILNNGAGMQVTATVSVPSPGEKVSGTYSYTLNFTPSNATTPTWDIDPSGDVDITDTQP